MKNTSSFFPLMLSASMLYGSTLLAQVMISPVSVTETGLGTYDASTGLTNLINHSGIQVPFTSGVTVFDSYFTPNDKFSQNADGTKWQSEVSFDLPLVGNLDFDLGGSYLISKLAIWNVSVKDVAIYLAADQAGLDTATPIGQFVLTKNTSSVSLRANLLDLGGSFPGRFLRLRVLSEYTYFANDNFAYATIGEVVVSGQTPTGPAIGIALEPNGDVTVNFTGKLQSSPNVDLGYQNIPGDPQASYTIPKASLGERGFFQTVDE